MRWRSVLAAIASTSLLACSLLVGTDNLSGGSSLDGGAGSSGAVGTPSTADGGSPGTLSGGTTDSGPPPPIKLATPAAIAPAVDPASPDGGASTAASVTAAAGHLLVVAIGWTYGTLQGSPPTMQVSDSLGNTWQPATGVYDNFEQSAGTKCKADAQIWWSGVSHAGSDVVTVATSQPGNTIYNFTVMDYTGLDTAGPVDAFDGVATPQGGTNLVSAPSLALTGPSDVVVAIFVDTAGGGQMLPGAGFTLRGSNTGLYSMAEDNLPGTAGGNVIASAFLPSNATNNCWSVAAAGFKAP